MGSVVLRVPGDDHVSSAFLFFAEIRDYSQSVVVLKNSFSPQDSKIAPVKSRPRKTEGFSLPFSEYL